MREVVFTIYRNAKDTSGAPISQPWERWVEVMTRHEIRGSPADGENKATLDRMKNGPAIVLGEIPAGKTRRGIHVRAVHALALDVEGFPDDRIEAALEALAPFEWVVWTTHKHGSAVSGKQARLRVVLPLDLPIEPGDHASAWMGLNQLVGRINDPATRDIGRLHFLPSTFDASKAWSFRHEGRWIRLEDLPDVEISQQSDFETLDRSRAASRMRRKLKRIGKEDPLKAPSTALLAGAPFAEPGTRHQTILDLTFWLADKDPRLDNQTITSLFAPSLCAMQEIDPNEPPTMNEVITAYDGAIERLGEFKKDDLEERKEQAKRVQLENVAEGQAPYTDADLARIAGANGWTVEELRDRWIVQRDGSGWFLTDRGDFAGPYSKDDLPLAASRYLARAPVRLIEVTRTGFRYRPINEIVRESGCLADHVLSDMTIQRSVYDPTTRTLHEAIRAIRTDLIPEFDPEIDGWLRIVGGPLYSKIVDWMACAPDLTKLLCAIYFDGAPSSGKTLFAHGMAKIWTEGPPADIESVLSDFNEELCRCPLVVADEEIPRRWRSTVTTTLRSMLSTMSRTLKRKYRPTSEVRGAIRLILAANNEFLLDSKDVSSSQDLEAIAQRFLYVPVPQDAVGYLNGLSRQKKERWMREGIARHALWLSKNHEVKEPGKRFWVEGDVSLMHRLLMTGSHWNSMICEWLVRYLMNPNPFDSKATGLIRREDAVLLVNDQAILDGWELYLKTKQEPETAKIGAALRAISKTTRRQQLRFNGQRVRYRVIDIDHLISWSDRYNIGDRETILAALGEPSDCPFVFDSDDPDRPAVQ